MAAHDRTRLNGRLLF